MTSSWEVTQPGKFRFKVLKLNTSGQIARAELSYISQIESIVVLLSVDFIVFKTDQNRSIAPQSLVTSRGNLYRILGCFNWPNKNTDN